MNARRGLVILAVLVIVASAALIATSAVTRAGAARHTSEASARRAETEALAWSGVQLALDEFGSQRDDLLRGESPKLTRSWTLYETSAGERAVVRLVADAHGEVVHAEAARVDLNEASAETLAALPGMSEPLAQAIVAARPFRSVRELARVPDLDVDSLAGLVGVFAYDPSVQAGVRDDARTGRGRINLGSDWSNELASAIDEQWGRGTAEVVKGLRDAGATFGTYGDYIRVLAENQVARSEWAAIFDAVCLGDAPFERGRVDLLHAPESVLRAVPGLDADSAGSIVSMRQRLSGVERRTLTWPITQGIVEPETWANAAPYLTMRSLQWRVRLEAGFAPPADADASAAALRDAVDSDDAPLTDRVVFDVVMDAGERRARLAFLRDATLESAWERVLADARSLADEDEVEPASDDRKTPEPQHEGRAAAARARSSGTASTPAPAAKEPDTSDRRVGRWRAWVGES